MLNRLSHAGYKITEPRRRVLAALREAREPLTALEVAARAEASVASTYRALTLLAHLGVVSEQTDPAASASRTRAAPMARRGARQAVFAVRDTRAPSSLHLPGCHVTIEVTCDALERALAELEATTGALIERHEVTLRGLCRACRSQTVVEG